MIQPTQIIDYNSTDGVAIRGTALVSSEVAPTINGVINWIYE